MSIYTPNAAPKGVHTMNKHSFISMGLSSPKDPKASVCKLWLPVDCYECGIYKAIPCLYMAVWKLLKVLPPDLRGVNTLLQMLCLGPTDRDVIENILYQLEKDGKIAKIAGGHWQVQAAPAENANNDIQTIGYMFAEPLSGHVFPYFHNSQKMPRYTQPAPEDKFLHIRTRPDRLQPSGYKFNEAYQTYIKFLLEQQSVIAKQDQAQETAPAPFEQSADQPEEDDLQETWSLKLLPGKAPTPLYVPLQLEISVTYPERWHITSPFWADTAKEMHDLLLQPDAYIGTAATPSDADVPASQYLAKETNKYIQGLEAPELVAKLSPEERIRQLIPHYYLFAPNQMKEMIKGFMSCNDHEAQLSRFIKVVENLFNRLHDTSEVLNSPQSLQLAYSLDEAQMQAILRHYNLTKNAGLKIFKYPRTLADILKIKGKNHGNSIVEKVAVLLVLDYNDMSSPEIKRFLSSLSPQYFDLLTGLRNIRNKDEHGGNTDPDAEGVTDYKEEYWTEWVKDKKLFVVMDKILQSFERKESI